MADISTELARILAATYGNEVRGSIHDAIEKINDVSEVVMTAGTDVTSSSSSTSGYYSGSLYYNTNTYELWRCIGSSWELLGSLKGSTGAQGIQGLQGIGIQSVTDNHDGTFSFTLTNGTSTGNIATIKGEKGDTGAAGAAGAKGRDVTNIQMTGTGKVHPISVTYSDGITQNIGTLQDGADGSGSGDMQFATYDPTQSGIVESARALSDGSTTLPLSTVLNKADKADSISGYGITDAYTKSEVDDSIEDAIEGLSASSVGGTGKIITQISESNGVVSATAASLTDIVDGSTVKVVNNKLTASSSPAQINSIEKSIAPIWQSGSYSSGSYVMDVDKLYKNNSANATTGIPGVSSDWVETSVADALETQTGTWTPTARDGMTSFTDAKYSRNGNVVVCSAKCVFGNISTTSKMYFGGLPFVPAVDSQIMGTYRGNSGNVGGSLIGNIGNSANIAWSNESCNAFANDTVYICFMYITK